MSTDAAALLDPSAELVVVGYFDERPGYAVERDRGARSWLLTWTVGGSGRIRQGGTQVDTRPGDLVVLGPQVPHRYSVAPDTDRWAFWWVHCAGRASWLPWLRPYDLGDAMYAVRPVVADVQGRIGAILPGVHADARWSGEGPLPVPITAGPGVRTAVATGELARGLAQTGVDQVILLAAGASPSADDGRDPRVRRVEATIDADPAAPHTVASLAAPVALSPSRLAHLFAAQTGRTPMQAVRDARLGRAARLLDGTDLPVDRVATAAGFVSAFHFSRVFRDRYGLPPGAYRRRPH